jgi:hypothetical protein
MRGMHPVIEARDGACLQFYMQENDVKRLTESETLIATGAASE